MNKRFGSIALLLMAGFVVTAAMAGPAPQVQICHMPPGNPDDFHTITVSENALAAHLAHGDIGGACNGVCAQLCNDGDACTIDDSGNCQEDGCPTTPVPVDCNDDLLCTEDSCNPASGCVNTTRQCPAPDLCTVSTCAPDTGECVDSPSACPEGYSCNPDNGECEADVPGPGDPCDGVICDDGFTCVVDADPLCQTDDCLTDWVCNQPYNVCGGTGGFDTCLCDVSVEGDAFCWNNIYCRNTFECQNSSDCPDGWTCATSCCDTACMPPCGGGESLVSEEQSSGPSAAGN